MGAAAPEDWKAFSGAGKMLNIRGKLIFFCCGMAKVDLGTLDINNSCCKCAEILVKGRGR